MSFEGWRASASAWPLKQLIAIWNDLPGMLPVQKFTSREIALERIWRFLHPPRQTTPRTGKEPKNPFREGSKAAQIYVLLAVQTAQPRTRSNSSPGGNGTA